MHSVNGDQRDFDFNSWGKLDHKLTQYPYQMFEPLCCSVGKPFK